VIRLLRGDAIVSLESEALVEYARAGVVALDL
jgi:hypothetical protein